MSPLTNGQSNGTSRSHPLTPGIYVPTVAFFDPETDKLDLDTVSKHAVRIAKAGVAGIATQGSNGEAVHLSHEERQLVTKTTRDALDNAGFSSMPLLVGCGAQSVFETVSLCQEAASSGGDYALVLPPNYYSGIFAGSTVVDYFTAVADASPIPIVIYNYPGATAGVDLNSDTITALSAHPNIIGCKFTCGNTGKLGRVASSVRASKADFICFAGSVDFLLPSLAIGGAGVIGGLANIFPRACVKLYELHRQGKTEEASALQDTAGTADWMAIQTGVVGVKAALQEFCGYGGYARRPVPRPDGKESARIMEGMKGLAEVERGLQS